MNHFWAGDSQTCTSHLHWHTPRWIAATPAAVRSSTSSGALKRSEAHSVEQQHGFSTTPPPVKIQEHRRRQASTQQGCKELPPSRIYLFSACLNEQGLQIKSPPKGNTAFSFPSPETSIPISKYQSGGLKFGPSSMQHSEVLRQRFIGSILVIIITCTALWNRNFLFLRGAVSLTWVMAFFLCNLLPYHSSERPIRTLTFPHYLLSFPLCGLFSFPLCLVLHLTGPEVFPWSQERPLKTCNARDRRAFSARLMQPQRGHARSRMTPSHHWKTQNFKSFQK